MSVITLHLPPDTERALRARAEQNGLTLERLLAEMAQQAVSVPHPLPALLPPACQAALEAGERTQQQMSRADFVHWLGQLSDGLPALPTLPAAFSRASLYSDHD